LSIGVWDPFAIDRHSNVNEQSFIRQIIRCKKEFHGTPRNDWVVIHDFADEEFEKRQGIDKYLFAQVRLLFKLTQDEVVHNLAYLEWYDITDVPAIPEDEEEIEMVARDPETQMAVAVRSGRFNVVSVDCIVRAVHMIPLFKEYNSARQHVASNANVHSFDTYLVNKYADRLSWEEIF
jgi:hypothetical protein